MALRPSRSLVARTLYVTCWATCEFMAVTPFGAIDPRQFLAQLDFFIYFHHPAWVEAFGRNILEAMASGLPAILPPHFRPLFGDAAIYAEPAEVLSVVSRLYADRAAYEEIVERCLSSVRARFGYQAHQHRLAELIGAPETVTPDEPTRSSPIRTAAPQRASLLLISSNGSGMGHLTRLIAYARRAQTDLAPHFLSLSQAVSVVSQFGFPFEYVPSAGARQDCRHDAGTSCLPSASPTLSPGCGPR